MLGRRRYGLVEASAVVDPDPSAEAGMGGAISTEENQRVFERDYSSITRLLLADPEQQS